MIELILTGPVWVKILFMLCSLIGAFVLYRFKYIVLAISAAAILICNSLKNKGK